MTSVLKMFFFYNFNKFSKSWTFHKWKIFLVKTQDSLSSEILKVVFRKSKGKQSKEERLPTSRSALILC